eukprot:364086-Chlamydomonas_euryale.AAC.3
MLYMRGVCDNWHRKPSVTRSQQQIASCEKRRSLAAARLAAYLGSVLSSAHRNLDSSVLGYCAASAPGT